MHRHSVGIRHSRAWGSLSAQRRLFRITAMAAFLAAPVALVWAEDEKSNNDNATASAEEATASVRPAVPGELRLNCRSRVEHKEGSGEFVPVEHEKVWKASETAIIICDMWDDHYCKLAAQRVDEMAPRMNSVITAARNHGVAIVHAPSATLDFYADTSYRKRLEQAPAAKPPVELAGWCYLDPQVEAEMPVDTTTSPCDDPVVGEPVRRYSRQHEAIKIIGYDGISDDGQEIYNYFQQLGVKNVVLMGVHTNMCVLGRPFGIRQMTRLGFNVVLARDLTDAMYDPREWPYVSHTRGTELVVEHIEQYWCPSIESEDLTRVIAGSADPTDEKRAGDSKSVTAK